MLDAVWLIPALPLAGFAVILLFGRRLGDPKAGYLATLMCGGAFVVTVGVFFDLLSKTAEERQHVRKLFSWVPVGSLKVDLAFFEPGHQPKGVTGFRNLVQLESEFGLQQFAPVNG